MSRRGENIYKRKDGRWEGRYTKAHCEGKIKYGYVYAKTYKEARDKLRGVCNSILTDSVVEEIAKNKPNVFGIIASEWIDTMQSQIKESSYVKYTNILTNHLFPKFENYRIEEIQIEDVILYCNELLTSGGKNNKGLSPKTVTDIISVLKNIFEYANISGKYSVADINKISIKQKQRQMRILSLSEQQRLDQYLRNNLTLSNLGVLLCLYTGLRIGEICALKWEDISFEEQYISVSKTMQRIQNKNKLGGDKTKILISSPKSKSSIRKIPIPADVFKHISILKMSGDNFFLTGLPQTYIEPRTMQNRFKVILTACGIEDANFHALRHTFATRCIELGFDVKSLSEILGHASVNITMNRYVHPSMELKKKNMDKLSDLLTVK